MASLLQDCKKLRQYDEGKANSLLKEIQAFKEQTTKINRKLARDIAAWVGTAMEETGKGGSRGGEKSAGGRGQADLNILDDGGEDSAEVADADTSMNSRNGKESFKK